MKHSNLLKINDKTTIYRPHGSSVIDDWNFRDNVDATNCWMKRGISFNMMDIKMWRSFGTLDLRWPR